MDMEKIIKELGRMCCSMENCADCNVSMLRDEEPRFCMHYIYKYPAEVACIVEEWSKAHPTITNGQRLCEVFGKDEAEALFWGAKPQDWWDAPYEVPKGA